MEKGKDFNDEIDSYIEERRSSGREKKRGFLKRARSWWNRKREQSSTDPIDVQEEELEEIERDIEDIDREEEQLEEMREGLVTKFLKVLRLRREYKEEDDEEMIEVDAEEEGVKREGYDEELVTELVKIQHSWLDKLPKETMKAFKQSEDFDRYVELLEELGMAKKE